MIHLPLEKTYGPFRTELNKFRIEAFCEVVGMAPTASVPISYLAMLAWASTTGRPRASVSTTVVASGLTMVVVVVSTDPELSLSAQLVAEKKPDVTISSTAKSLLKRMSLFYVMPFSGAVMK